MSYHLLTGATGLLGNYLMRNLLLAGIPVAVLVRPGRRQTARQRVELLLAEWEDVLGEPLPRPVVLEGDISQPDLGLDAVSLRWAAEYCTAVIHNAASLTFHATSREGEPFRSNIDGTRNVLEFCRGTRIRKFHHVSTAYVAGLRTGRVLETERNVGQKFSNDYEESKLAAEQMVRDADFIDPPTVFRPAIIIGDSKTGVTTTYHGFYAALQLVHTIVKSQPMNESGYVMGQTARLALTGQETKHLVPVDWVADFMLHVLQNPELHGKTYHLTPKHPVTTRTIRDVLEDSNRFFGAHFVGTDRPENLSDAEAVFYDHIRVYDSYWRMDPEFDRTNTEAAAPHMPCPHVNYDMLLRLSEIVIAAGFPTPSKKPVDIEHDVQTYLQPWTEAGSRLTARAGGRRQLALDVYGPGGGQWQLIVRDGQIVGAEVGIHDDTAATCRVESRDLISLFQGQTSLSHLIGGGQLELIGDDAETGGCVDVMEQLVGLPVN